MIQETPRRPQFGTLNCLVMDQPSVTAIQMRGTGGGRQQKNRATQGSCDSARQGEIFVNLSSRARSFVEWATRNWIYVRHLPREFGRVPIFVTPAAGLKYLFKPMSNIDPPL